MNICKFKWSDGTTLLRLFPNSELMAYVRYAYFVNQGKSIDSGKFTVTIKRYGADI